MERNANVFDIMHTQFKTNGDMEGVESVISKLKTMRADDTMPNCIPQQSC